MKSQFLPWLLCSIILFSCSKEKETDIPSSPNTNSFTRYQIAKGQHYADQSSVITSNYSAMNFEVKFDSSAIYTTVDPSNQYDVNKLYGFSDNNAQHHQFSARIGWRWSDNALRLFAYTYNAGVMSFEEISRISIGEIHKCSIIVSASEYIFTVDGHIKSMPRASKTISATGYKLFPYFGGDEAAPHDIFIWINEK